ncbi:MAG: sigma-70 family RNA polymerase sigma factor [Desulfovibrio sp.]|nr:sigma-70 family RNA polymerase sigma factor [Desulfovibrio sp.]MCA1984888.1 sigma-70 family RNA polymerase sigma factor [Desulfovibrio sp.]
MRSQHRRPTPTAHHAPSPDLNACLAGDEDAWRDLLATHGPLLRKAVRWTLRRHAANIAASELETDVDDVFQDVCFRLIRSEYKLLRTYDPTRASLGTWLCVVARSAALDHLRARTPTVHLTVQELEAVMEAQEDAGGLLSLPRELLTPRQLYVLHLYFEQDADTHDIAALLDVHPHTVRSIRNAALARLRWHYRHASPTTRASSRPKETQRACKAV